MRRLPAILCVAACALGANAGTVYYCPDNTYTSSPSEAKAKRCKPEAFLGFDTWADRLLADPNYAGYTREELRDIWIKHAGLSPLKSDTTAPSPSGGVPKAFSAGEASPTRNAMPTETAADSGFTVWHWIVVLMLAIAIAGVWALLRSGAAGTATRGQRGRRWFSFVATTLACIFAVKAMFAIGSADAVRAVDTLLAFAALLAIFGGLAFAVGWATRTTRVQAESPQGAGAQSLGTPADANAPAVPSPTEAMWAEALAEYESERRRTGLWAQLFAEANGDESAAKAKYLAIRAAQLQGAPQEAMAGS